MFLARPTSFLVLTLVLAPVGLSPALGQAAPPAAPAVPAPAVPAPAAATVPSPAVPDAAEARDRGCMLFVSSEPMGALVFVDGAQEPQRSPLLLRGLKAGLHRLKIVREGWLMKEAEVELPATSAVEFRLSPLEPRLHFEGEPALTLKGEPLRPADGVFRFSPGVLKLIPGREGLDIEPVFGRQDLLDGVRLALPLFIGLTGVLTAREIIAPPGGSFVLDPELAASALVSGGLLGCDIALEAERTSFLQSYRVGSSEAGSMEVAARSRFEAAVQAESHGDFAAALGQFEALAKDYPGSPLAPKAIFEAARLQYIAGDRAGAAESYREIVEDYPIVELYDRAVKGLADCYLAAGDTKDALDELDLLTYLGPGLSREEIELFRKSILPGPDSH
ncbi:MAG TPA: tetratricopeptide repeat protein [Rectinemataceae bacterium]|nr:tetratricopeptide repeat protein [Rectinemataceae bacterium]